MTDEDLKEVKSAGKMTAVMTAHHNVFKDVLRAMSLKTELIDDMAILQAEGASAISAMGMQKDGTQDKNAGETALEKLLRKIAANGKTIKTDDPTFDNTFKLPSGSLSNQDLLDTGYAFKNDLTPAAVAKFGAYGYFDATPENIQTEIDAILAGSAQQNAGRSSGIAATAEERAAVTRLKKNRRLMKTVGENIVEAHGDPGLIAEWKAACKLEKNKPAEPPTPPTP